MRRACVNKDTLGAYVYGRVPLKTFLLLQRLYMILFSAEVMQGTEDTDAES